MTPARFARYSQLRSTLNAADALYQSKLSVTPAQWAMLEGKYGVDRVDMGEGPYDQNGELTTAVSEFIAVPCVGTVERCHVEGELRFCQWYFRREPKKPVSDATHIRIVKRMIRFGKRKGTSGYVPLTDSCYVNR